MFQSAPKFHFFGMISYSLSHCHLLALWVSISIKDWIKMSIKYRICQWRYKMSWSLLKFLYAVIEQLQAVTVDYNFEWEEAFK